MKNILLVEAQMKAWRKVALELLHTVEIHSDTCDICGQCRTLDQIVRHFDREVTE